MANPNTNNNFFKNNPGKDQEFLQILEAFNKITVQNNNPVDTLEKIRALLNNDLMKNINDSAKYFDLLKIKDGGALNVNNANTSALFAQNLNLLQQFKQKYEAKNPDGNYKENILNNQDAQNVINAIRSIKANQQIFEKEFEQDYIENFNETQKQNAENQAKKILVDAFKPDILNQIWKPIDNDDLKKKGVIFQIQQNDKNQITGYNFNFSSKINNQDDPTDNTKKQPSTQIVLEALAEIQTNLTTNIFDKLNATLTDPQKQGIKFKNKNENLVETEAQFNENPNLQNYFGDVLFKNGSLRNDIFIQKKLISDYLDYLGSQNKLIYENTKIKNPDDHTKQVLISDYIKSQKTKFEKLIQDFEKIQHSDYNSFKASYDNLFNNEIQTQILNPITNNVLNNNQINQTFTTQNLKDFDISQSNKDFEEIKKNLLKDVEGPKTLIGKITKKGKDLVDQGTKTNYFKNKSLANLANFIEDGNGVREPLFDQTTTKIEQIVKTIELTENGKQTTALALDIEVPKDKSVYFDCHNLLSSVQNTVKFASAPVFLKFKDEASNEAFSYAKISSNQQGEQNIEISGRGMFVELTEKKLPGLDKIIPGLKSVFIMQNSSGQLGFYDKDGNSINNSKAIDEISKNVIKGTLSINGQDINDLAKQISQNLSKQPSQITASGINVGQGRQGPASGSGRTV